MLIYFLKEEENAIKSTFNLENYNFIPYAGLDKLECDILFVLNKAFLKDFIRLPV